MRTLLGVVTVCLLIGADRAVDSRKKEMRRLQGEWSMVYGEIDGQVLPEGYVKGARRIAKDKETTVLTGGRVLLKATVTIDPTKKPKTIDYQITAGLAKGQTQRGIYELTNDKIKFCFASPGKARPTAFSAPEGSGRALSFWKRAKK